MTTLLVLYRRPEGGAEALAEFERRYATSTCRSSPQTPGLRATRVQRVGEALGGETDLAWSPRWTSTTGPRSTRARLGRRCAPPAGTCARSRRASRRSSSLEDAPRPGSTAARRWFAGAARWILSAPTEEPVTETAPPRRRDQPADAARHVAVPGARRRRPASTASRSSRSTARRRSTR